MSTPAGRLLAAIHPACLPGETVEARFIKGGMIRPVFYSSGEALVADLDRWRFQWNCYFGVNLRQERDGTAAGIRRAGTCYADIDVKLWADTSDPEGAALAAVESFPLRPTALVHSGHGFQPYWALTSVVAVDALSRRDHFQQVNAAVARAVCGPTRRPDPVQDVARILRLPGTLNFKDTTPCPVRLLWCEPARCYPFQAVVDLLSDRFPWALRSSTTMTSTTAALLVGQPIRLDDATLLQRALQAKNGPKLERLLAGDTSGYPSASEADLALAGMLAFWSDDPDQIRRLMERSRLAREKWDSPRGSSTYLNQTINTALTAPREHYHFTGDGLGPIIEHPSGLRIQRMNLMAVRRLLDRRAGRS